MFNFGENLSAVSVINAMVKAYLESRVDRLQQTAENSEQLQSDALNTLLSRGKDTLFGENHNFGIIQGYEQFRKEVPIRSYEELFPYIERALNGERNVLWPGAIRWFAKSSGTTNDRSKFIPVTKESLEDCHYKGGRDALTCYTMWNPDHTLFDGKSMVLSGSVHTSPESPYQAGDISAVLLENMPWWIHYFRAPSREIALMGNWEDKLDKLAAAIAQEDITFLSGVPSWMLVVLKRVLEMQGKTNLREVWPNFQLFIHGAVNFEPYRPLYRELCGKQDMHYLETYNASEGFFALQDRKNHNDMLLMTDYGVYYEFVPLNKLEAPEEHAVPLNSVQLNQAYALVISTNGGLWRYLIGDTIEFTSLRPYRIRIIGRTKHFINAFGEELMVENAEKAIAETCEKCAARVREFTVAPIFQSAQEPGGHEWLIEFDQAPDNLQSFIHTLDNELRSINADYDAKRTGDLTMALPKVHAVETGLFYRWMSSRGKIGAQHKVPRLSNDRTWVDQLQELRTCVG